MRGDRKLTRLTSAALGLVLALAVIPAYAAADWPSYRGGPSQNMSRPGDPGTHPQQVWASVSSVRQEPCAIAVGDSVFTIATPAADFGAQRLFRIEAASGEVVWSSPTFEATAAVSCPAVEGPRVFFAHGTHLTALDVADGSEAWDVDLGGSVGVPVASDGRVYVSGGAGEPGTLFALDADDGGEVWSAEAPFDQLAPLVFPDAVVNLVREGSAVLSAFDPATGAPLWTGEGPLDEAIGVGDEVVYSSGSAVSSRDASDGSLSWTKTVPVFTSARKLVADDARVYALVPSANPKFQVDHVIAWEAATGKVVYDLAFGEPSSCCGTTGAYPPFAKFGPTLYNHYRHFEAATGESFGTHFARTHEVFYDETGCANEQDSVFAIVDRTVYLWKWNCPGNFQLVARRDATPPDPFGLHAPWEGFATGNLRPSLVWQEAVDAAGGAGLSHFELTLDGERLGGEIPPSDTDWELGADLGEGPHTWSVDAVDQLGNRRTAGPATFVVDTVPPESFDLAAPADGAAELGSRPAFSWAETSDAGSSVDRYELRVDGLKAGTVAAGLCEDGCSLVPEKALAGGSHTWNVRAFDAAGNMRQSETRAFTVDSTPPSSFGLLAPPAGGVAAGLPRFEWEASADEGAGLDRYELILDGKKLADVPAGTESFTAVKGLSSEKTHSWSVVAVDAAGNRRESETRTFTVDTKAPQSPNPLTPSNHDVAGPRPQFTWSPSSDTGGAGLDHYELILDGETIATTPSGSESFAPSEDLAEGQHIWSVAAVDAVGNRRESDSQDFKVDATPPASFELLEPADEALTVARPQFAWTPSSDTGSGLDHYELILDGETIATTPPGTRDFTPPEDLEDGLHTWSVIAVDDVGNERQSESRTFTSDASPPAPFGLLAPADGAVTGFEVELVWEEAVDVGPAGLDRYEVVLNGEKLTDVPAGTESFTADGERVLAGSNTWSVTAFDKAGNQQSSEARGFVVATPPAASLSAPELVLTETPVSFDASGSSPPPGGSIVKYEWDLNGDGTFERDTGETPTTTRTYANVKDLTVSVRVSSSLGTDATAVAPVSVRLAPPPGHLGVTINEGAEFTNKRNVTISPVWPAFAQIALVSNDGGFREAEEVPLAAGIKWKLDSAGAERLPKTIYVRFQGAAAAGPETYQDDIILDLVKPKLLSATVTSSGEVGLRARDETSGVSAVQVAGDPQGASAKRWRPFKRRIGLSRRRGRVFVRVRDRAGNMSVWRRAVSR